MKNIKLKEWVRNKLVGFIMLDKSQEYLLSEINRLDKKLQAKLLSEINRLDATDYENSINIKQIKTSIGSNKEDIDILHNTLRSVVSVGTDVVRTSNREKSWAVICIEGHYNVVKFIDMHGADYRYILDFLKQFEGSRMVIDVPNQRMFEDAFKLK